MAILQVLTYLPLVATYVSTVLVVKRSLEEKQFSTRPLHQAEMPTPTVWRRIKIQGEQERRDTVANALLLYTCIQINKYLQHKEAKISCIALLA